MSESVEPYIVSGAYVSVADDPWALLSKLAHADERLRRDLGAILAVTFQRNAQQAQLNALNDALAALGRKRLQEAAHGR